MLPIQGIFQEKESRKEFFWDKVWQPLQFTDSQVAWVYAGR